MKASVAQGSLFKPCGFSRSLFATAGSEDQPSGARKWKGRRVTNRTLRYTLKRDLSGRVRGPRERAGNQKLALHYVFEERLGRFGTTSTIPAGMLLYSVV